MHFRELPPLLFKTTIIGGNMKKYLALFILILLAVPAVSFAGSATSRWDLTIGGMINWMWPGRARA